VIAQARKLIRARIHTDGNGDVVHLLRLQYFAGIDLPGVEDLAAQWHHRLKLAIACLFGRAARRVALDQK
jgi:hypothetical protein